MNCNKTPLSSLCRKSAHALVEKHYVLPHIFIFHSNVFQLVYCLFMWRFIRHDVKCKYVSNIFCWVFGSGFEIPGQILKGFFANKFHPHVVANRYDFLFPCERLLSLSSSRKDNNKTKQNQCWSTVNTVLVHCFTSSSILYERNTDISQNFPFCRCSQIKNGVMESQCLMLMVTM